MQEVHILYGFTVKLFMGIYYVNFCIIIRSWLPVHYQYTGNIFLRFKHIHGYHMHSSDICNIFWSSTALYCVTHRDWVNPLASGARLLCDWWFEPAKYISIHMWCQGNISTNSSLQIYQNILKKYFLVTDDHEQVVILTLS